MEAISLMTSLMQSKRTSQWPHVSSQYGFSVREMNILSLAVMHSAAESSHTLAILHQDYKGALRLCSRDISADLDLSSEYSSRLSDIEIPDALGNRLIANPPSTENSNRQAGLLVVGGKKVHFYPIKPALRKPTRGKGKAPAVENPTPEIMPTSIDWDYSDITA